jgi:DNA polymerase-3 subunit delta'
MQVDAAELGAVVGHEDAKREFLDAVASGRLHHGWLLRGPRGIGKARLALQFAMHLLGRGDGSLTASEASSVGQLIIAGSHPDIRIIRRPVDDAGKQKSEIPADSVRALSEFFSLRPAMGGWRIAIIDALDELNRFGSNALLKTLEEPPARTVLFLISHGEQLLLPTVRSRCHEVRLSALSESETMSALIQVERSTSDAEKLARLAPGRPGRAVQMEGDDTVVAASAAADALRGLAMGDGRAFHAALMQSGKSEAALTASLAAMRSGLESRARRELDPVIAGSWADAALQLMRIETEAKALNQDRAQTVAAALAIAAPLLQATGG